MGLTDMLNAGNVLKLRIIVYCLLICFSFFIFVGIAVMKDKDFYNKCPLYLDKYYASYSNCDYPLSIAVIFQLIYMLFRVATLVLALLGKLSADFVLFSDIFELVYVAVDFLAFILTFISACILSAGTNAVGFDFAWKSPARAAQAGAWIGAFLWLFIAIIGFITLWRAGKIPFLGGGGSAGTGQNKTDTEGGHTQTQPPAAPEPTV